MIRFVASLAISIWGVAMMLLGIVQGVLLWVAIGLAVTAFGLPLLGSHPWLARRLYPNSGNIEGGFPPEPTTPPAA